SRSSRGAEESSTNASYDLLLRASTAASDIVSLKGHDAYGEAASTAACSASQGAAVLATPENDSTGAGRGAAVAVVPPAHEPSDGLREGERPHRLGQVNLESGGQGSLAFVVAGRRRHGRRRHVREAGGGLRADLLNELVPILAGHGQVREQYVDR